MSLFDKEPTLINCIIAVTEQGKCIFISHKPNLIYTEQGYVVDIWDGAMEEWDGECDLYNIVSNSEDIPKQVGIYKCKIEIEGGESYFNGSETDYYDIIYTIKDIKLKHKI